MKHWSWWWENLDGLPKSTRIPAETTGAIATRQSWPAAGSVLVIDDLVILPAGNLMALEAKTGKMAWEQQEVRAGNASPPAWHHKGRNYLLSNTGGEVVCVDARDGKVLWKAPGGGHSSPVVAGDTQSGWLSVAW